MGPVDLDALIALRDMALSVVRAKGSWEMTSGIKLVTCACNGLQIALQTPFQRAPQNVSSFANYVAAKQGKAAPENLPYTIDVWSKNKVLSIQWSDDGRVLVVSYKAGEWEGELERLVGQIGSKPCRS